MINLKEDQCKLYDLMNLLGGKWKLEILWQIVNNNGIRFNSLRRNIPGITNVMLIRSLNDLIDYNFVRREDKKENPPHVEYYYTEPTEYLMLILEDLADFGDKMIKV